MAQIDAGKAIIEALRAEGVDTIFGLVGSTTNTIVCAMYGREDVRFLDTRHEEGAAFMAYGYARASGKPTACLTTSGPATINLATGIALAYKGRAPVVAIAGDVDRKYLDRDGAQSFDLVNIFKPITSMSRQAYKTERIPELIHDAFRSALSGKRGPVFINIPRDLMDNQTIDDSLIRPSSAYRAVQARIQGDRDAVKRAAELLSKAERPVLIAGGGVVDGDATNEAVALAERLEMALIPAYGHNDAVPNSHPLYIGIPGNRGAPEAMEAIHRADVILALGSKLNQHSTHWDSSVINPQTRIVQVDIDVLEVGRNHAVEVGIVGDAKAVAQQLLEALGSAKKDNASWRADIEALAKRRKARLAEEESLQGDPMMPQRVYPELRKALPKDCMVTLDAGVAPGLTYDRLSFELPGTFHNYAGHGGLGMGYCVGLGTKIGRPDRPAISIQGDGGFLYTSQELNTAVRHGIPLVALVLNNSCHGAEKAQQKRNYQERFVGVDLVNPRFDKLAEVYGAKGYYVTKPSEIADAVTAALATKSPCVIEIPVAEYFPTAAKTPGAKGH
ncbi:MAG TPA: thiamine pyrophosphate-binding protein [Burkholderiales bacterium]|nr:thiamine pyrophosphate-binding protein [Burkholderiales bacterium]